MATPAVSSLSPARGHTGGQVFVAFIGTGFKLPAATTGIPRPVPGPSVAVRFGGELAADIQVVDTETLTCLAPPCPLTDDHGLPIPGTVDVVITNLDADGVAIPGESLTLTDAFEYQRPDLGAKSFPHWVLECLMRQLMLQVVPRVDFAVHTDYRDREAIDHERIPDSPCLVITDVDFITATTQSARGVQEVALPNGRFVRRRAPKMVDCELSVCAISDTVRESANMLTCLELLFEKSPKLRVPKSINKVDPDAGVAEYDMDSSPLQGIRVTAGGSESNIKSFARMITVHGIPFEDIPGLPNESTDEVPSAIAGESVLGTGYQVGEVAVDYSKKALPDPT